MYNLHDCSSTEIIHYNNNNNNNAKLLKIVTIGIYYRLNNLNSKSLIAVII